MGHRPPDQVSYWDGSRWVTPLPPKLPPKPADSYQASVYRHLRAANVGATPIPHVPPPPPPSKPANPTYVGGTDQLPMPQPEQWMSEHPVRVVMTAMGVAAVLAGLIGGHVYMVVVGVALLCLPMVRQAAGLEDAPQGLPSAVAPHVYPELAADAWIEYYQRQYMNGDLDEDELGVAVESALRRQHEPGVLPPGTVLHKPPPPQPAVPLPPRRR